MPQYQAAWEECEVAVTERLHRVLLRMAANEDRTIRTRINNLSISKLKLILFPYLDPAFRNARDLDKIELSRGFTTKAKLKNLTSHTSKKIGRLLAVKFLEFFYTEFHNRVWARRCELMIQLEHEHGITTQQKLTRQSASAAQRNGLIKSKEDINARRTEAFRRCEGLIHGVITQGSIPGWGGFIK